MNTAWNIVLGVLALWGLISAVILIADAMVSRRYKEQLDLRDWTEKVDAMRRIYDEEGKA